MNGATELAKIDRSKGDHMRYHIMLSPYILREHQGQLRRRYVGLLYLLVVQQERYIESDYQIVDIQVETAGRYLFMDVVRVAYHGAYRILREHFPPIARILLTFVTLKEAIEVSFPVQSLV